MIFVALFQHEVEPQTAIFGETGGDFSAMQHDGILHDGQSEARAAHFPASPFVHPIEPLEKPWQVLGSDAHAVVAEGEMPPVGLAVGRERDGSASSGIVEGVVGEIPENSVEQLPISLHANVLGQAVSERHLTGGERMFRLKHDVGHHCRNVDSLLLQHGGGVVHLVERGNVLQEGRESLCLGICALDELVFRGVVDIGRVENRLGVAQDAGHGRFQFVGDVLLRRLKR